MLLIVDTHAVRNAEKSLAAVNAMNWARKLAIHFTGFLGRRAGCFDPVDLWMELGRHVQFLNGLPRAPRKLRSKHLLWNIVVGWCQESQATYSFELPSCSRIFAFRSFLRSESFCSSIFISLRRSIRLFSCSLRMEASSVFKAGLLVELGV